VFVKVARTRFAILILLAAMACNRQPGRSAAGDGTAGEPAIISDGLSASVAHDPRAMTSIDVATGDLAALANYGAGRAMVSHADRAGAAVGQPAVATLDPVVVEQLVAAAQPGGHAGSAAPPVATENSAIESEPSPPNAASPATAQPAP
jgi:hypothetical protein